MKRLDSINVVYTDFRPTPLENYVFIQGDSKILLLKDAKGNLLEKNYQKIQSKGGGKKKRGRNMSSGADLHKIVKLLAKKKFIPAIIFAFSKKEVERLAKSISTKMNLLTESEQKNIRQLYQTMIGSLSEEDKKLP